MGNVGNKIAAGFVDTLGFGEIAEHGDSAAIGQGRGGDIEGAAGTMDVARVVFTCFVLVAPLTAARKSGSRMVSTTGAFRRVVLRDKTIHGLIRPLHQPVGANRDHRVLHAIEQSFELALAGTHGGKTAFDLAGGFVDGSGDAANFIERLVMHAGAQIALLDANGDIHDAIETTCSPNRGGGGDE